MEYVRFGNSGLEVSRLCLGAMDFPLRCDRETSRAIFFRAFDAGINFIDTADAYGPGTSEEVMGELLHGVRDQLVIATKFWVKMYDRPGGRGCSRYHIMSAVEDSLRRLRTDRIDLYQLHHPDHMAPVEETLSTLDTLVKQGKVRYIGVCNHYAWQMAHMLGVSALHNWEPLVSIQCRYNIVDRVIEMETVPFAKRFGIATMIYGPLHGGILAGAYRRDQPLPEGGRYERIKGYGKQHLTAEVFDLIDELEPIAQRNGLTLAQLAMKWILSKDFVTTPIVGGSRPEHFEPIYDLMGKEVDSDDIRRIDELSGRYRYKPFENQHVTGGAPLAPNWW